MTSTNKKSTFRLFFIMLLSLLFTSCTTKFSNVYISTGYIVWNSIIGTILLIALAVLYICSCDDYDGFIDIYDIFSIVIIHALISLFLFILPFLFCPNPKGKEFFFSHRKNLFWLKCIASSAILSAEYFIMYLTMRNKKQFGFFILSLVLGGIEITALLFSNRPYLWGFSHLATLYVLFCSLTFGRGMGNISSLISGPIGHKYVGLSALINGAISFLPLYFDYPKGKWAIYLGIGFGAGLIIYFIYWIITSSKADNVRAEIAQKKKEKADFEEALSEKKSEALSQLGDRVNESDEFYQTRTSVDKANTLEEIDELMEKWTEYEQEHPACTICGKEYENGTKYCSCCGIDLENPYPICPECGKTIDYFNDNCCTQCGFDWIRHLENRVQSPKFNLLHVVTTDSDVSKYGEYEWRMDEGAYLSNQYIFLKSKGYSYSYKNINIYGKKWDDSTTKNRIQGVIHKDKNQPKGQFAWYVYSPKLFNETHEMFERKQLEEAEKLNAKKEEDRLRAKEIGEQTGDVLD